jgi:uncharacterized protein YutE (UPF0331/DUF86 family)
MPDRDIILAKTAIIQRCLKRIKETTKLSQESLEDPDKQDIFVLNLQRAVQAAIDLATHIVATEGLGLPETVRENFEFLLRNGIIPESMSDKMKAMVGFRNIAIHNYQAIDLTILKAILTDHLKDLEDFYTTIIHHFIK